jgi:hypothetical protein
VVLPALVLWLLAAVVSVTALHPGDVREYEQYARAALHHRFLHHLPLEYPAPALAVFILPLALPLAYPWAFAVLVGIVLLLLVTSYDGSGVPKMDAHAAGRLIIYLAVGSLMVLAGRYDLFAVATLFWSLRAAGRQRWGAAWTWSSVGFALKLFPAVLWPALLVAEWRAHGRIPVRRVVWMAAAVGVVVGIPALFDHPAALNALRYYQHRPTETGSLPAGLSLLTDWHGTAFVSSFHSRNVVSGVTGPLSVAFEIGALLGCLWTWRAQARGRLPLEAACLLTLTLVVLGSKVLSVQYLMWLMPLWSLYRLRASWLAASAANLVVFPYAASATGFTYVPAHAYSVSLTLTFLARDLLVAAGTWAWLRSGESRGTELPGGAHAPGLDAASEMGRRQAVIARD